MILKIKRKFDSAHYLPEYKGKCRNLHGHTWMVIVEIEGKKKKSGMVIDFKEAKRIIDKFLFDHKLINNYIKNPTAENIAEYLYNKIKSKLNIKAIEVWESEDSGVRLEYEENKVGGSI